MRKIVFARYVLVAAFAAVLSGCAATQLSDRAEAARKEMIGMTREQILACMGPAKKKGAEGNTEVWTYLSTNGHGNYDGVTVRPITGLSHTTSVHDRNFCYVNIVMTTGIVTAVNYNGPTGDAFAPYAQCGYAIANCVHSGPGDF